MKYWKPTSDDIQVSKETKITVKNKRGTEQFLLLKSQSRKDTCSKEKRLWGRR